MLNNPTSDPNITVSISYNGEKCVILTSQKENTEVIEYIQTNATNVTNSTEEIVEEIFVYVKNNDTEIIEVIVINKNKEFKRGQR